MIPHRKFASNRRLNPLKQTFEKADDGTLSAEEQRERLMLRDLSKALRELWRLSAPGAGSYRPDLHYMRGPGPKWHAKYGGLAPKTPAAAVGATSALPDVVERHA
jgi:hypothetical protein